jgi:hypothetical protein
MMHGLDQNILRHMYLDKQRKMKKQNWISTDLKAQSNKEQEAQYQIEIEYSFI